MPKGYTLVNFVCVNCLTKSPAQKYDDGTIILQCPLCGAKTISSRKSRRKITLEVTAPKGQCVLDEK